MSIQVTCVNGHVLTVHERHTGKTGRCPVCKAEVNVPHSRSKQVSEDAILDMLGPHKPRVRGAGAENEASSAPVESTTTPKKSCERCNREIPTSARVCPFCHTYLTGLIKP